MRRHRPLLLLLGIAALLLLARALWSRLGIDPTPAGVHTWVSSLGVWAPVVFVAVVAGRHGLALPSALVLTVGGLCFGTPLGTALGAVGIVISGVIMFAVGRWAGADWVREHLGPRFAVAEERLRRTGPTLVAVATAYPIGPLTAFHVGAGLASVRITPYVAALVLGAPVRAFAYSWVGSQLLDTGSPEFWMAMATLAAVLLAPLAFPSVRRWLFGGAA